MTSPFESTVREGLRQLADQPAPPSTADRALAGARHVRRRRRVVTALAAIAGAAAITLPFALVPRGDGATDVVDATSSTTAAPTVTPTVECRTVTTPPALASPDTWPSFVATVVAKLPPRDDYVLTSAHGVCEVTDGPPSVFAGDERATIVRSAEMRMSVGGSAENGGFSVLLVRTSPPIDLPSCAELPSLQRAGDELLFCDDATAALPTAYGGRSGGDLYAMAMYPDGRMILFEDGGSPFDLATMRALVTDPDLAALVA